MPSSLRVLALGASTSRHSINTMLVTHAAERLRGEHLPDAVVEIIDLNDYEMPIYSIDREREGDIPLPARFYEQLGAADALLISYAEHNGFYTAAFKNIFDWSSRIGP
jgi:chromate reductase